MSKEGDMPLFGRPNNTSRKGEITESMILARLVQLGYECLIPWGHDHRYDIAIDDDGKLVRIQCKTPRYVEEWESLNSPETVKVYLVSVDEVPIGSKAFNAPVTSIGNRKRIS